MNRPLRILHLEDERDFSTLVSILLEREGLHAELVLVTDFKGFNEALENESFDLILADYMLPSCNGSQALEVARQKCPQTPFVLLSGAIGEHAAIEFLQSGATDYVLKSGLERLVPAIQRAVQEPREAGQPARVAEAEVGESDEQYRRIFEGSPVPMWVADPETGVFLEVNETAVRHYGYSRDKFLAMTMKDICAPEEASRFVRYISEAVSKRSEAEIGHAGSWQHRKRLGALIDVEMSWSVIPFKGREALLVTANDVTETRQAAELLKRSQASLAAAQRIAHLGSWALELADLDDLGNNKLHCSEETGRIFGLKPGKVPTASEFFFDSVHPKDRARVKALVKQALDNKEAYEIEHQILRPGGEAAVVRQRAELVLDRSGKPVQIQGVVMEIPGRKGTPEPNQKKKTTPRRKQR